MAESWTRPRLVRHFGGKPDSPKMKAATQEKESSLCYGDNGTVSGQRRRQHRLGGKGVIQQFQNL
jgi:hypothetical protein